MERRAGLSSRQVKGQLQAWLSRVEVLARGGERLRQASLAALAAGRPWEALQPAEELLELSPASPSALLLWADVTGACGLLEEASDALARLAPLLPHRADVWYRLAEAEAALGRSPQRALERADEADGPRPAADAARIWLCDLDLDRGDVARAERWLARVGLTGRESAAFRWRQVEALLDSGRVDEALGLADAAPAPEVLDGYGWLMRGRAWAACGDASASWALTRALLLEAPRVGPAVAAHLVRADDAVFIARVRDVVSALGWQEHSGWRAAFAEAEGRFDAARAALAEGAAAGASVAWLRRYAALAVCTRSAADLTRAAEALESHGAALSEEEATLQRALTRAGTARLEALLASPLQKGSWAEELLTETLGALLTPERVAELLRWLEGVAESVAVLHLPGDSSVNLYFRETLMALEADLSRPLRVAVVGEFNAGKSSFINAWLGQELTQVGVVPTTAKSHHLAFACDPYLRLELVDGSARVLPLTSDASALIAAPEVLRVVIHTPHQALRELELVDTPGFNSGHAEHTRAVTLAVDDAHVALWLLDATQPLSQSEIERLRALRERGLPLILVVNKLDRLDAAARAACLAHVESGLAAAELTPAYPVIAVSARQASSDATRASSGWSEILMLEAALRRDAGQLRLPRLTAELRRALEALPPAPPSALEAPPERSLADAIEAGRLVEPLRAARAALERDLLPLRRELERGELDPGGRRYAAARARERWVTALTPLVGESGVTGLKRAELLGLIGGFAAADYRALWLGEEDGERDGALGALLLAWCREQAPHAGVSAGPHPLTLLHALRARL
ncbi:MAG: dynamin family protein [Polyangiaceae bacterium]|nr:dynamin family protein [Polyangiaceae bacterium]MCW5791206.1 dynamin family protein [Polyangiaceae bacterium]